MDRYESSLKANEAYAAKDYQLTVDLYTDALGNDRKPAMIPQEAYSSSDTPLNNNEQSDYGYPKGVQWLITSLKNSCRS